MPLKIEKNAQGRIKYEMSDEATFWLSDEEFVFINWLNDWNDVITWRQEQLLRDVNFDRFFSTEKEQNSFIKRMLKYGVLKTDYKSRDGNYPAVVEIYLHSLEREQKLHIPNGHNLEHWIRDRWDKYSTESMEVVTVLGAFDVPNQHRMFIAKNSELHSFTIDATTDKTVWAALHRIEQELKL